MNADIPNSTDITTTTYLSDGGMETTFVFHEGIDLPEFASFPLLQTSDGLALLRDYYRRYLQIAVECETGFILETPTWRANPDWARKLGFDARGTREINVQAVAEMNALRREFENDLPDILVSGCMGPRGDGYSPAFQMSEVEAQAYHATQIGVLADHGVDLVTAMTLNYSEEAIGIVRAARAAGVRPVISFTVETNGCLATGESLREAIERTDVKTDGGAAWFMINCAHPTHFEQAFQDGGEWTGRIQAVRANASRLSHEELDNSETLDDGDPIDLGDRVRRLTGLLPNLNVFGGCCGTDHRHVRAIGKAIAANLSVA